MGVLLAWEDYLATGDPTHMAVDYDILVARNLDGFLNGAGLVEKDPGQFELGERETWSTGRRRTATPTSSAG